jgi:hypothetical protein
LFTGAEGTKTVAQAEVWGGIAGTAYDPCYYKACDNFGNMNLYALDVNADAVAYATLQFAFTTKVVNGIRGTELNPCINNDKARAASSAFPAWQAYRPRFDK